MRKVIGVMVGLWLLLGALSLSAQASTHGKRSHFRTVSSKSKFKSKHHGRRAKRSGRSRVGY